MVEEQEIVGVLAGLATSDMAATVDWLTKVIGRGPSACPMPSLADWYLGAAGTLQVVVDPDRAGGGTVTLQVADIAATRTRLAGEGIDLRYDDTTSDKVKFGLLADPDGNNVTLIEAKRGFDPRG